MNRLKGMSNREKRSLTETDVIYEAVKYFSGIEDSLKDVNYKVVTTSGQPSSIQLSCVYDGERKTVECSANGAVEAVIASLDKIINVRGERTLHLARFDPRVVPKVPQEYLQWQIGEYPKTSIDLDVHSDLRVQTGIRNTNAANGHKTYYGIASEEDSFKTVVDSIIDAVRKMITIERWYAARKPIV